jgi:hypothetical protein
MTQQAKVHALETEYVRRANAAKIPKRSVVMTPDKLPEGGDQRTRRFTQKDILRRDVPLAIAQATTLDEEIAAFFAGAPPRTKEVALAFSGHTEWPAPTLESLGARKQITRERVRQLVTYHLRDLQTFRAEGVISTPYMDRAIAALDALGGVATLEAWHARAKNADPGVTVAALRSLTVFCDTYVLRDFEHHVVYSRALDRFCTALRYETLHDDGGALSQVAVTLRLHGRKALRRYGAVRLSRLAQHAPALSDEALAGVAVPGSVTIEQGFAVPKEIQAGVFKFRLGRAVRAMLAVTPDLTIADIARGLARMGQARIRLPLPVLHRVLSAWLSVTVERGRVRPKEPFDRRASLKPQMLDIVEAIEAAGGRFAPAQVKATLLELNHEPIWLWHVAYEPFFVRLRGGDLAIRGPHWALGEERSVRAERSGETDLVGVTPVSRMPTRRHFVLVRRPWPGDDETTLRLRVTPHLLGGAVMLPKAIRERTADAQGEWVGVDRDSAQWSLNLRHDLLWGFAPWLVQQGAELEGHVVLRFDVEARRIGMSYVTATAVAAIQETFEQQEREHVGQRQRLRRIADPDRRALLALLLAADASVWGVTDPQLGDVQESLMSDPDVSVPGALRSRALSVIGEHLRMYWATWPNSPREVSLPDPPPRRVLVEFVDYPLPEGAKSYVFAGALIGADRWRGTATLFERRLLETLEVADFIEARASFNAFVAKARMARGTLAWRIRPAEPDT